jgi:hypothetical protein
MTPFADDGDAAWVAVCATLVTIRDGTRIRVRPVVPSDRVHIEAGFEQLSEASRRSRFFTPLQQLPEALLRYLTVARPDETEPPPRVGTAHWKVGIVMHRG